ncbi:aldehyde ferredoxin oxidoreductase [Salinarchaeum sp. IM2453]|uniref:aldehyde ferredoxin oxidoreductase family protein n=1 Tax=Salinarchaeum sp. IM2453 TaxID=2862870 RepID=UPI001C83C978|nr:aldehyde ferredoxin oxidoreductase C-terminal domain-containing protein [Salinarchaeum sp. IM2453]QZA88071.1 aldehyde ferredoxin oxidoreductase [Salinarchaeum sp. IM2453]
MLHTTGDLLSIDVGACSTTDIDIDSLTSKYIGGRALATRLAHERIPFDADPMGPKNRLFFTTGPLQMSQMSFTGRMNCTGISPLTDGLLSSNAGGFLSRNFASTGYAAVELAGSSDELLVIHVRDDEVQFEPAHSLHGATVPETLEYLEAERDISPDQTTVIGPAGENAVRFASIMTSGERAFGRGGLGAVMGAKNVKAVTFAGDRAPSIEIPSIQQEIHREAATDDHIMKDQGTVSVMDLANEINGLPSYYFSEQSFDGVEEINGAAVADKKYKKGTCSTCAFACKLPTRDEETGIETEGPEFEVAMAHGSNSGVDEIVSVMKSNDLCDSYGLDAISAGNTIAAYLAAEDEFGNTDLIHRLLEKIAHREGIGDKLAEGIDRVHEDLGVENWSVKGLDFAAHEGRVLHGQGLSYAVANRGADHMYATFYSVEYPLASEHKAMDPEGTLGKASRLVRRENLMAVNDSGVLCKFARDYMTPDRYEELFACEFDTLLNVGAKTVTLERHFNNQRGFDASDDRLPYDLPDLNEAINEYYTERGWNAGVVPDSQLPADL